MIATMHKTFDRQAESHGEPMSAGNVWGHTQFSNFVRAHSDCECNGFTFEPGHLRNTDLGYFNTLPSGVRKLLLSSEWKDRYIILTEVRYWRGKTKMTLGYIISDAHGDHAPLHKMYYGRTRASRDVIDQVAEALKRK